MPSRQLVASVAARYAPETKAGQLSILLPLGLNLLRGEVNPEWGQVMALALMSLAPMLLIFLAFQRYLIQGIASTRVTRNTARRGTALKLES